jgi:exo-beta-1,3-glucanase (GH17 family)
MRPLAEGVCYVMDTYPDKEVLLTEFGWPAGPKGYSETNQFIGQKCGVASNANQNLVIRDTLAKLDEKGWSGVVFEAFREQWKERVRDRSVLSGVSAAV